jgi:PAT family beta-lactamase induction signal transducer AmpG
MTNKTFKDAILNKRMLICITTGFSSGLPLYLLIQFVPAWLRSADIDLSTIGLINLVLFRLDVCHTINVNRFNECLVLI